MSDNTCTCGCSGSFKAQKIYSLLPQLDCNKCGFATCQEFAESLSNGEGEVEDCSVLTNPRFTQQFLKLQQMLNHR